VAKARKQKNWQRKQQKGITILKAQIHPHFLFNTLTIFISYADLLKKSFHNGDETSGSSTIYSMKCNQPIVPLEKELKYTGLYVA